jgi:hypothetical protein
MVNHFVKVLVFDMVKEGAFTCCVLHAFPYQFIPAKVYDSGGQEMLLQNPTSVQDWKFLVGYPWVARIGPQPKGRCFLTNTLYVFPARSTAMSSHAFYLVSAL